MEQLTAITRFPYDGKMLQPNQDFEAAAKFARILIAIGKARRRVADVKVEPPKSKRQYRRRDLTAE